MSGRTYTFEQVRELIETLDVPMSITRGERILAVNAAYAAAVGFPAGSLEGRSWLEILAPEERLRMEARAQLPQSQAPTTGTITLKVVGAGGRSVHFAARVSQLPAADGGSFRVCTAVQLHESERRHSIADLLTAVSAAMISARSEDEVRARSIEQFQVAGLSARFLSLADVDLVSDPQQAEILRECFETGLTAFAGTDAANASAAFIPVDSQLRREVLVLEGTKFSSLDASTMTLFSRVVSSALASGRMISDLERIGRESRRQLADTQLMLQLARTTSGTLELRAILDTACDFLVSLLDVSNCFIMLYDEKRKVLRGAASSTMHRDFFREVELSLAQNGIAASAARERRAIVVEDTSNWSGHTELIHRFDEKALLAMPLITRDELLGVVVVDDVRGPRTFDPEFLELAEASISQLALSVANARLYQSLRESYSELARTRAEMVKRERLAALGELAAIVAHEVRNPLGVIFNAVSSMRRVIPCEGDGGMLLGIIAEESDRLNRMVGDLLDFARPRALSMELEDLPLLIRESVEAAKADPALSAKVGLELELPGDLPPLPMDRPLLRQALVNILLNAMQAMPRGGTVRVCAGLEEQEGRRHVRVEVSDQGAGIPKELMPRVFEPFFTTKARGTGLGLAVVRRIVEDHRGEVQIHSEPGRGTTFAFRLPLAH